MFKHETKLLFALLINTSKEIETQQGFYKRCAFQAIIYVGSYAIA